MQEILDLIQQMRITRGWDKTDTIASLIKSVSVEAGELLETIQWDDEQLKMDELKSELADVLMYALSICIDLDLDVKQLIAAKMPDVYARYPEIEKDD